MTYKKTTMDEEIFESGCILYFDRLPPFVEGDVTESVVLHKGACS